MLILVLRMTLIPSGHPSLTEYITKYSEYPKWSFINTLFSATVILDIIVLIIKTTDYLVTSVTFNYKFDFYKIELKVL